MSVRSISVRGLSLALSRPPWHGRSQPADCEQHRIQQRSRWLPCPCWSTAVRVGANKASCATSAESGTRQLSDYRVDDPVHSGTPPRIAFTLSSRPRRLTDRASGRSGQRGGSPQRLSSQPISLGRGHSRTGAHVGRHRQARWLNAWTSCLRLIMRRSDPEPIT
jgi:hypothetical protein